LKFIRENKYKGIAIVILMWLPLNVWGFIHILTSQIPRLSRTWQCQIQGHFQWIHELLMRKNTPIFHKKCNWLNSCMLMIRNIDLYVQIPGLLRTSTKIPGLSRSGIQIFKFQDFPGYQGPVQTLCIIFW